jgi:hypothetical protein
VALRGIGTAFLILYPYPIDLADQEMGAPLPRTLKPYFVLLELLRSLEAFIYYTISMSMYEVEPEPRAENSSLFRLRVSLPSCSTSNIGLNEECRAVFIIKFWTSELKLAAEYSFLKAFYRDTVL